MLISFFFSSCDDDNLLNSGSILKPTSTFTISGTFLDSCNGKGLPNLNLLIRGYVDGPYTDPSVIEDLGNVVTDSNGNYQLAYESKYEFDDIQLVNVTDVIYAKYEPELVSNPVFVKEFTYDYDVVLQLDRIFTNQDTLFFGRCKYTNNGDFISGDIRVGPFTDGERLRFSFKNGMYEEQSIQYVAGGSWSLGKADLRGTNHTGTEFEPKHGFKPHLVNPCNLGEDVVLDLRGL